MLNNYFAAKLNDMGYPAGDIRFALNYRLGDGVAFFGPIAPDNMRKIADRLLCEQGRRDFSSRRALIRKAVKLGAHFEIVKLDVAGCGYANSMYVKSSLPDDSAITPYQAHLLEGFTALLREDVMATSVMLSTLGYTLLAAAPSDFSLRRVFVRGGCLVLVKELPEADFDPFKRFGAEEGRRIVDNMVLGQFRHYALKVEIHPIGGGPVLGEAMMKGVIEDLRDGGAGSGHFGNLRMLMREAANSARAAAVKRRLKAA